MRPLTSSALLALTLLCACGQEAAPADPPVIVVEPDTDANAVTQTPQATEPAPAPVTKAAPATVRPADVSDMAVEAEVTPALAACLETDDAAKGVSYAMGGCFREELGRQDERLNAAYRAAMAKRDAAGKARLRDEERAWIKRRDEECEAQRTGGTIDLVEVPACLMQETIRRRIVLQGMAG